MWGRVGREGVVLCCPRPVFKLRTLYRQTDTAVTLCSLPTLTLSLEVAHSLLLSLSQRFQLWTQKSFKCFQFAFNFNWWFVLWQSFACWALLSCFAFAQRVGSLCALCVLRVASCCLRLRAAAFVRSCFVLALPYTHTLLSLCHSLLLWRLTIACSVVVRSYTCVCVCMCVRGAATATAVVCVPVSVWEPNKYAKGNHRAEILVKRGWQTATTL